MPMEAQELQTGEFATRGTRGLDSGPKYYPKRLVEVKAVFTALL